jgi:tetratricopeptide (TPR) repeat protein
MKRLGQNDHMARVTRAVQVPGTATSPSEVSGPKTGTLAAWTRRLARSLGLAGTLVVILTAAAFLPALGNGFVNWDDDENFLANPYYRGLGWPQVRWMFTTAHAGPYIPITWLTLGLDFTLWGMKPAGYHATSVIIHTFNAMLVFVLARRLLAIAVPSRDSASRWGAATAALLFAIHPLRVESVAWVTERRDLVSGCFVLLTLLAYLTSVGRGAGGRLQAGWRWIAVGFFLLALLSKPIAVGLPAVLVALDCYPLGRLARMGKPWLRGFLRLAVVEKAPFLLVSGMAAALALAVGRLHGAVTPLEALGVLERLAISGYGLTFYVWKTVAPWPLSPLYTLFRPVQPWSATYLIPGIFVVLITAALICAHRRWPAGLISWVSYAALLFPVIGIFHNGAQVAADRYTYLACLPWALLAGAGVLWCLDAGVAGRIGWGVTRAVVGATALIIVLFLGLTMRQVGVWRDSVTLWRQAAAVEPESDIPIFFLGWALADAGRFDEGRAHFERARARVPDSLPWLRAQFTLHLGIVEERAGRPQAAESWYREALTLDPAHPVARIRLGALLFERGERAEAGRQWTRALALFPEWNRYQLWEIRSAIEQVPLTEPDARGRFALALAILLEGHRALDEAGEQYALAGALLRDGDPAQREACERARRLAGARSPVSSHPTACGAILPR